MFFLPNRNDSSSHFQLMQKLLLILLIAGPPSHGPGEHEHRADCLLLKSCLDKVAGVTSIVYSNGWPQDAKAFEGASSIVLDMDGGSRHPALPGKRLQQLAPRMKEGACPVMIHYPF